MAKSGAPVGTAARVNDAFRRPLPSRAFSRRARPSAGPGVDGLQTRSAAEKINPDLMLLDRRLIHALRFSNKTL